MRKIIAVIDGLKYSESVTNCAISLAQQSSSQLMGVFLEEFTYQSYNFYQAIGDDRVLMEAREMKLEQDQQARNFSRASFQKACEQAGVSYSIHHERHITIRELLHESVYADLLIIDRKETLSHFAETIPTNFIRDLLSEIQCSVLIVPTNYRPIDKLVLLYDGQPASVYAIRTFSYVLPTLTELATELISVKNSDDPGPMNDHRLMKEFMKRLYPKTEFTILKGSPHKEIVHHLEEQQKNLLIVLGAYRRGMVSRWFRHSITDVLMQKVNACLFIAHN